MMTHKGRIFVLPMFCAFLFVASCLPEADEECASRIDSQLDMEISKLFAEADDLVEPMTPELRAEENLNGLHWVDRQRIAGDLRKRAISLISARNDFSKRNTINDHQDACDFEFDGYRIVRVS